MAFDPNSARPEGSTIARPAFNPATATPAPPEEPGLLRQGADLLLDFAQGGMGVVGAGAAAFGADNVVAKGAGEIAKYAAELQSQQRQAERQGQAERMQAAEATGSMWEEAKAAGQNFLETPGAFTASAVGSAVPTMAAAMLGGLPAAAVTGGGIGAGAVKQSIYERIEQEALKAGQTPEQAAATASAAQAYTGESADQIALGTGLGLAAGGTGLERVFGGGTSAIKNIVGRVAAGTAAEAVPEAVQGGQERLAANLAAQRDGFGGETWTGVVGQGVTEGLASTGPGAVGGLMTPYLDPNAGPISRAAIQAQAQRAAVVPGTLEQAAAAAPTEQDAPPESAGNPTRFDPSSAVPAWLGQYEQTNPIATTGTSPAAPNDQQQDQPLRLVPMKNEEAAARRAEAVAKRTGTQHVVIPHPSVPERFAVVPVDSPLASPATPTDQAEGLDVEGLFSTQAPIPLKNARNLAGMMSMAGGVEHAVVPSPAGDGFGIAPVDQLSPAQRDAWAGFQPGARRGVARRAPGPVATPPATATPTTSASTTSSTATPIGTPDVGPELAQVTGTTPPAAPAVPEGAQGFNTEAQRAAPALPQIDNNTFTTAVGNAQATIKRERWTIDGGRRFEGRIRAELERAGVPANAAQAVIDLAKQQTPTDSFVSGDALAQAARTLGVISSASTTATPDISPDAEQIEAAPQRAPQADTQQDKPTTTRAIVPGQTAKGRDVLLAQVEQLKQRTAPADLVQDYNGLKDRIADARRRASLKATKRTEAERLTEWADNQDRELERLRKEIGFVELKAGTARYRVLNTPENLEAFAQKLKKAPVGRWTVTVQPEEIYDNLETRAGTTEKQRETGRSAVRELARRVTAHLQRRGNHQDRAAIEVLGSRLYDGFAFDGGIDLVGQRVTSAEDLATLAQVFRDPRFETFRVFFTDTQGTVVGEGAYSSRLPAAVNLPSDFDAHIRRDMGRFGATSFWLVHNHPSGRATPSPADVNLTKWIASSVNGFRGHVVIDHNEFATIDAGGAVQVVQAPQLNGTDFGSKPELDHHMLGSTINGERDVVQAAKALQVKNGHAALIFLRRDQKVQLVMDVPMALLQDTTRAALGKLRAVVRAFARESGAGGWRFLVLPDGVSPEPMKRLVLDNIFTDIVSADGTTAGNFGAVSTGDFLDYNIPIRRVKDSNNEAPYSLIGTPARTIDELAALAADLPTGTALVVTDGHRIRSVTDVPAALLTDRSKFSRARLRMLARRASREPGQTYLLAPEGTDVKPLRWLVKLEGLRDVVTADATSAAAAIERANRVAEAAPRYSDESPPQRRSIADWARGTLAANRPWMLGALTRDQIVDIWGRDLPQIIDFDRTVQAMDTDRASIAQAADEIVERWRKLPGKQADALADVMHSATLAGFDPDTMNATQPEHDQILADWNALPDEAHAVYREARDAHRATLQAIRNGLADRAERTGSMGRQIADRIRLDFDKFLSHGVYFPLSRFGDLLLIADRDGERTVEAFESGGQREARARQLRADGWRVKMSSKSQYSAMRDGAAGAFTQEVMQHLEGLDVDPAQKSQLFDTLNQLAISMLPDASYRRHFKHRKGVPGFSRDAMRGFAQAQQHAAHHIARIRHADRLVAALDDLQAELSEATEGDVTEAQHVANELTRRLEQILNPNTHPVAAAAGQVGFVMSLGGSIAAGLTNLSQTPLVFFPWAGSRFGFDKAAAALTAATRDYLGGKWDRWSGFVLSDNPNIAPEERDALKQLEASGIINLTLAHDLAGAANTDSTVSRRAFALNRAMKVISWTFHLPETYNRQVSALTAYRLAREAGQTHEEAIETARDGIVRSHFDYSASNRARYLHGNFIRVVTMFKQYSQQMTYMLWRSAYLALKGESAEVKSEARRMLFGVMSMHFAAAGSLGLPLGVFGISPLLSLLAMGAGDEDDPPLDWQDEYRLWLADTFGRDTGEAIAKGPVRLLLDVDLASRVGLGDLWVRAPLKEKEGRDAVEQWMVTLLGPIAGYAGQMGTAMQAFEEGQFARGVESMMPKFIAAPLKALRYETEGVRSWRGDDLGVTLSNADIIGTAMGFQPTALSEMYAGRSVVKGREAKLQRRREDLMRAWREAREAGDRAGLADALAGIRKFNEKNRPFSIGPQHLKASWMAHRRAQLQTAQGINLSRRRDELRDYGRFAVID
ncbi:MAG: PLxRFG domain-containing protein [Thauera propionica]|jgi:hypothetical protein|nr:PLxRFG domain-containing protein [Thauera propionica]